MGPLALAGFFLPWAEGPGFLAGHTFSGFTLVGFAGRLHALDLGTAGSGALLAARLAILGVAVAAAWQTVLAPAHRAHAGYALSGWYLVAATLALLAIGLARSGVQLPPGGLAALSAAAALYVAALFGDGVLARSAGSGDEQYPAE